MWGLLIGLLVAGALLLYGYRVPERIKLRAFPQVPLRFWTGQLHTLRVTPLFKAYHDWSKTYGDTFVLFAGSSPVLVTSDPALIKSICIRNFMSFHDRNVLLDASHADLHKNKRLAVMTSNLLLARGRYWAMLRGALQPIFHTTALQSYAPVMTRGLARLCAGVEPAAHAGDVIDFHAVAGKMTLGVIVEAVFGIRINTSKPLRPDPGAVPESLYGAVQTMFLDQSLLPTQTTMGRFFLCLPASIRMYAAPPRLRQASMILSSSTGILMENGIKQARARGTPVQAVEADWKYWPDEFEKGNEFRDQVPSEDSIITRLIQVKNPETGRGLLPYQIAAQCNAMLMAGYETSANGLSFIIHCLSHHPEVESTLLAEIDAHDDEELSLGSIANFPYTAAVVKEALRLYPPAPVFNRQADEDCEIAPGKWVPKGTWIHINTYTLHRNPALWKDPESFKPARFLSKEELENRHPQAYLPFGLGPRMCIGYKFALEELQIALISLYREYTFKPAPGAGKDLELSMGITMVPKHGVMVTAHRRQQG